MAMPDDLDPARLPSEWHELVTEVLAGGDVGELCVAHEVGYVEVVELAWSHYCACHMEPRPVRVIVTLAGGWVRNSTPTYGGQARRPALDRRRVAGLDGGSDDQ